MALPNNPQKKFAYDLSKDIEKKGEIHDVDVINQSIENILSTIRGERLFMLPYGSDVPLLLFEDLNEENGEVVLDSILDAVERWEDRIILQRDLSTMNVDTENNRLQLSIPYYIKNTQITTTFERNIYL